MNSIIRRVLPPALAALSLLATAIPASAGSAQSTTGGCTGMGQTNKSGSLGWTETDATPYGGCGYVFSQGRFYMSFNTYIVGPGWVQASYAISTSSGLPGSVLGIDGFHNLCNSGGPCNPPGSQQWITTYN